MRILFSVLFVLFCSSLVFSQQNYLKFVDTFIGTDGHGHTYPGASAPFGMMQLSPDTGVEGWDCS